ncbi:MAG TPA: VOC family protein [Limnochordia bacterium]|nr:VOC family protein [Limnochordia bacterium]
MKLNHLDLQVSDVDRARAFFETHFGFRCTYRRQNQIAILEDDYGFAFGVSNLFNSPAPVYPPDFHVGFHLQDAVEVRAMYERLQAAGVAMKRTLQTGGPSLYFQCLAPDDIPVEVSAPRDDRD